MNDQVLEAMERAAENCAAQLQKANMEANQSYMQYRDRYTGSAGGLLSFDDWKKSSVSVFDL